ncbi:glycosyltransferase [Bacteroides stercorirosoris]|jgi:glycosyltransferase involved in cell wall biosynthesis|uniref:glycosyltransferase n=1 Tax=Bacteroides stercorirosoris TaxID=871324 RepID=UPI0035214D0D
MKELIIFSLNAKSPGIDVIISEFSIALKKRGYNVRIEYSLTMVKNNKHLQIIPYGPKETYLLLCLGYKCNLSLMVDYYSLGCRNKLLFYLAHKKIYYKDFWYSLISFIRYYRKESYIFSKVQNFMFVSKQDISIIKKRFPLKNYYYVGNGVNLQKDCNSSKDGYEIKLGILSHWTFVSLDECRWFINDIFNKLRIRFPNIKLVIAGRGANQAIRDTFISQPSICFLGEINNLSDFFNNIDIYVATVPKGCGILNKVLDAFAYRTFTIGVEASFSAFRDLKEGYVVCKHLSDYIDAINLYLTNSVQVNRYINNAYMYVEENHQWGKNYNNFIDELIKDNVI